MPALLAALVAALLFLQTSLALTPLICEQPLDNEPGFDGNAAVCLLGCGTPRARASSTALPGSVNITEIPYCQLNCVRNDATPQMSAAAPGCSSQCGAHAGTSPQQQGWCMYYCVEGGPVESLVLSRTCVPSLQYTPETTILTSGPARSTLTYEGFTVPPAWVSWYETQTVIPHTQTLIFASTPTPSASKHSTPVSSSDSMAITSPPSKSDRSTASGSDPWGWDSSETSRGQLFSFTTTTTSTSKGDGGDGRSGMMQCTNLVCCLVAPLLLMLF